LALGLPVVSTAVLGTKTVLDGAQGAIVVDEDESRFAGAVERVLADRELRTRLAARAPQFVATRWSSGEMAKRMLELYERTATRAPVGAPTAPAAVRDCER
jgi:glycosyltransferase involved in cell wall biosynthesis